MTTLRVGDRVTSQQSVLGTPGTVIEIGRDGSTAVVHWDGDPQDYTETCKISELRQIR
jgi:hypothetical protein